MTHLAMNINRYNNKAAQEEIQEAIDCASYLRKCTADRANRGNGNRRTNQTPGSGILILLAEDMWDTIAEWLISEEMQAVATPAHQATLANINSIFPTRAVSRDE